MPAEIGFYHVMRQPVDMAAARLLEKIHAQGLRCGVRVASRQRVRALDTLLWTYDPDGFLPHGTARNATADLQPIFIADDDDWPNRPDVLMVLDDALPEDFSGFKRLLYMFDGNNDAEVVAARTRWSALKAAGATPAYWRQADTGGWSRQQ